MDITPRLEVKQKLSLTPEMRQRLAVLSMSALELRERIDQELLENPALELEEFSADAEEPASEEEDADALDENALSDEHALALSEWDEDLASYEEGADWSVPRDEAGPTPVDVAHVTESFTDHLLAQLGELPLSSEVQRAAELIALSLDEDGYFRGDLAEVADQARVSAARAGRGLEAVQMLEPAGVGARDLVECLVLQLSELGEEGELVRRIVREHLKDVAEGRVSAIARAVAADPDEVATAITVIRSLTPRPAATFGSGPERQVVVPEFEIRVMDGRPTVLPLADASPVLRVSQQYARLMRSGTADERTLGYLRSRLRSAHRFVRDIERRRETLQSVAQAAVDAQADYFVRPEGELVPLRLEQVASVVGVHPSTVSRAVSGKYAVSPRGIVELRRLFSGGLPSTQGAIAVSAVHKRIREIIDAEPKDAPLSDERLARLLAAQGLDISRRTVAKYREQMGVAPSWKRREP